MNPRQQGFGFDLPADFEAEQDAIVKRERVADALLQRSMLPLATNAGPLHWTQALAQVMNAGQGRYEADQAAQARKALGQRYQQGLADEVKRIATIRAGTPITETIVDEQANDGMGAPATITTPAQANPRGAIEAAVLSQYPQVRQMGQLQHQTYEREATKANDREARLHERILALDAAAQNAQLAREERAARAAEAATLRRELAAMQDTTRREIAASRAGADKPKLKPGERFAADGVTVEAIPGSDLYISQSNKHGKDFAALQAVDTKLDNAASKIDNILDPKNRHGFEMNFGGWSAYGTQYVPESPITPSKTQTIRKEIDSLKSDLKSAGLEMIRQGGSIGTMTEKEWPIVEQMIASISPVLSETEARDKLKKIKTYMEKIKANAREAYDTEWGRTQFYKKAKEKPTPPGSDAGKDSGGWSVVSRAPSGVDQRLWDVMTPEERKLWDK